MLKRCYRVVIVSAVHEEFVVKKRAEEVTSWQLLASIAIVTGVQLLQPLIALLQELHVHVDYLKKVTIGNRNRVTNAAAFTAAVHTLQGPSVVRVQQNSSGGDVPHHSTTLLATDVADPSE